MNLPRVSELALGHLVNGVIGIWAFDYVLYPTVVWKLGLVKGGALMALLSFAICLLTLRLYDAMKRDWLGIEAVKELRDGTGRTRLRRVIAWAFQRGDIPGLIVLSLVSDPFITTACLRRGAFNGMNRRDWRVFASSWLISNGSWALACFGVVELLASLGRFLIGRG